MKLLYSLTFLLLSTVALAQPGGLDKTFNADFGLNSKDPTIDNYTNLQTAAFQSDGSIVVYGRFAYSPSAQTWQVQRFKPDGTPDPTFTNTTFPSYSVNMAIQPDDKIILVGTGNPGDITRLNADGTVDQDFASKVGTGATSASGGTSSIMTVALDANGKILIGGFFEKFNGTTRIRLARLNSDGSVDTSFTPGEGATNGVSAINFQSNGKIIIAGGFTKYDGSDRGAFARVNTDGTIDATFNPVGFVDTGLPRRILVLPDDKLIVAGSITNYDGISTNHYYVVKTDANGVLDTNFLSPFQSAEFVETAEIYDEDHIIVGGGFSLVRPHIARMNINTGAVDPDFKPYSVNGNVNHVLVEDDGNIIMVGGFTKVCGTVRNGLARIHGNGKLEGGRGADNTINALVDVGDGEIVVGGDFTGFRGIARNRVAKVDGDGHLDEDLDPAAGANGAILAMAKDANGKIIIAGNFTQYRDISRPRIARIDSDGTLDDTFNPGIGFNATVRTILIQPDGMILVGGDFTNYDGADYSHIIRLEDDGDIDPTFEPDDAADGNIQSIALQSDGKIIIAGSFANFDNNAAKRIARLNTNGTFDATFDPGNSADATIYAVKIDGDDNVLVGGAFTVFDDNTRKGIARLTSDGELDDAFDPGDENFNAVRTISFLGDNIFIGGDFEKKVALLHADGGIDTEWYPTEAPDGTVVASIQLNGKIIVAGQFTTYDGVGADRLARINNVGLRNQKITFGPPAGQYAGTSSDFTATATSGLTVTFTSGDETHATVDGNTITFLKAGPVTITANQLGDARWAAAEPVSQMFTVNKGNQTIVFDYEYRTTVTGSAGDQLELSAFAHSTAGLTPLVFTSSAPEVASVSDDGTKLILHTTGEIFLSANHDGNDDFNAAPSGTSSAYINLVVEIDVPTGVEDEESLIVAYPNPTEGLLNIQLPSTHSGSFKASLLNTLGVELNSAVHTGHNLTLDLSSLPKGLYFVKIQGNGTNVVKRIQRK